MVVQTSAASSLQRSRRSSRRTSGQRSSQQRADPPASTEPSFFTTDKTAATPVIQFAYLASTEPSFFTTDKARDSMAGLAKLSLQRSRRSSRRTSWWWSRRYPQRLESFNGAVVLHDGQADSPHDVRTHAAGFNGAVVLHDGQVLATMLPAGGW